MINIVETSKQTYQEIIDTAVSYLKNGEIVVFPSDTVYGLLVDAKNESAVTKLIEFKNRPIGKAISVFVAGEDMIYEYGLIEQNKKNTVSSLIPGPFTIVIESKNKLDRRLASEKNSMGFRFTQFDLVQDLVLKFGSPITSTSANLGGKSPHYSIKSLLNQLPKKKQEMIGLIVDHGVLPRNKPSTVIDFTQSKMSILRKGDLLIENEKKFVTKSAKGTRSLAKFLLKNAVLQAGNQPIIFLLKGDLGAGKTEFTRGLAFELGIKKIVSPTYVIYYEYTPTAEKMSYLNKINNFIHADLYNIEDEEDFQNLQINKFINSQTVAVIEWGEKLGKEYFSISNNSSMFFIEILHGNKTERFFTVSKLK